jgi:hypothetical protein
MKTCDRRFAQLEERMEQHRELLRDPEKRFRLAVNRTDRRANLETSPM